MGASKEIFAIIREELFNEMPSEMRQSFTHIEVREANEYEENRDDEVYLKLKKAEKNNALFAQWPEDETSIDNTNGVVMLTGFSQSGKDTLYTTASKPEVMARLSFEVLKLGKTTLDWEFSGSDDSFKSVMLTDGSPPQNVLETKPSAATFTIEKEIVNTAITWNKYVLIGGLVLILFGAFMLFSSPRRFSKKGTIVIYEED